jgi:hypothetical protein
MSSKDIGYCDKAVAIDVSVSDQVLLLGCRAFYVGGAGNLAVTMRGGGNVTFTGLQAGTILPVNAAAVLNSGTTATGVIALL